MTKLARIEDRKLISTLNDFAEIQERLISRFISEFVNVSSPSKEINLREQFQTIPVMSFLSISGMSFLLNPEFKKPLVASKVSNKNTLQLQNSDLLGKPKKGVISALGEEWQFTRHGMGILFVGNESNRIVDAHREIFGYPRSFDAWRLSQYFESLNCLEVVWKSTRFAADDDDDLEKLLELLEQERILKLVSGKNRPYQLVDSF